MERSPNPAAPQDGMLIDDQVHNDASFIANMLGEEEANEMIDELNKAAGFEQNPDKKGATQQQPPPKKEAPPAKEPAKQPAAKAKAEADPSDEQAEPDEEEEEGDDTAADDEDPYAKMVLGDKFGKKKAKDVPVFENLEELNKYNEKQFGHKDLGTTFKSALKWKEDSKNLTKVAKERDYYKGAVENLPDNLRELFDGYYNGRDVTELASKIGGAVDYSKPFQNQPTEKVIKALFPDVDTSAIDFKDKDDPQARTLIQAAEKLYSERQGARMRELDSIKGKAEQRVQSLNSSIESSVGALKTAFPRIRSTDLEDIEQTLRTQALELPMLQDEKGNYTPDAAVKLFYLNHGPALTNSLRNVIEKQLATIDKLQSKQPTKSKSKSSQPEITPGSQEDNATERYIQTNERSRGKNPLAHKGEMVPFYKT